MQTIRIDKYLSQLGLVSRRDAKKVFRSGMISINGHEEYDHGFLVKDGDMITIDSDYPIDSGLLHPKGTSFRARSSQGQLQFEVKQSVTLMLHKPAGYVCSEIDEGGHLSYKHLLSDCIYAPLLKVAGRLDQDTTGLVIATSDGQLIHRLISPRSGKEKEYKVTCNKELSDQDLHQLEQGVIIDTDYKTLPAKTVKIDSFSFFLIITEGKFHQIKKMCEAIGNECVALHRLRIGAYMLGNLSLSQRRYI